MPGTTKPPPARPGARKADVAEKPHGSTWWRPRRTERESGIGVSGGPGKTPPRCAATCGRRWRSGRGIARSQVDSARCQHASSSAQRVSTLKPRTRSDSSPLKQTARAPSGQVTLSDNMDRSAASRTDSDLASSASLAIWSVAQAARRDIRPTAWSRLPRRYASTSARTSESLAQRWAVRSDTPLALAHSAHDLPAANAAASSLWRLVRSSLDMVLVIARWQGPPRLLLAPLAVLSPRPRLAGALNGQ